MSDLRQIRNMNTLHNKDVHFTFPRFVIVTAYLTVKLVLELSLLCPYLKNQTRARFNLSILYMMWICLNYRSAISKHLLKNEAAFQNKSYLVYVLEHIARLQPYLLSRRLTLR